MTLVLGESRKMCNSNEYYRSMTVNVTQYDIT